MTDHTAQTQARVSAAQSAQSDTRRKLALALAHAAEWLRSPMPYLMLLGFALFLGFWHLSVEVWKWPRFKDMPGLTIVVSEWLSRSPVYGMSIYSPEYFQHIWISMRRVLAAFSISTVLGVSLGLFLGWSRIFKGYVFPLFELFRPIPALAWIPLSIAFFKSSEGPIIFLTCIAPFFATTLNTMLGVVSIDKCYVQAASCLGASRWQVFRHIIIPGALPFIFTGLQISMGLCWFSLVAGEYVSGNYGLGYLIILSFMNISYPNIVIAMITLGAVGYCTSAIVRMFGNYLTRWRARELAMAM